MKKLSTLLITLLFCSSAYASELSFKFDSPSFSGIGKSSHYLTIENIEKTRKDAIKAANKAAADKLIADAKSTAIAKFKANVEARFYTALAKQLTDNVFGTEVVTWATTTTGTNDTVTVTVTESDGTVTTFTMPKEDNS